MSADHLEPWLGEDSELWVTSAESWIREVFEALGLGPLESVERIKARPWSIVLRARSNRAVAYFKASGSGGAHESGLPANDLPAVLQRLHPRELVSIEPGRITHQ